MKKATKLSSQPAQYIKKIDKDYLEKKKSILCKINEKKKTCKKKEKKAEKKHGGKAIVFQRKKQKN